MKEFVNTINSILSFISDKLLDLAEEIYAMRLLISNEISPAFDHVYKSTENHTKEIKEMQDENHKSFSGIYNQLNNCIKKNHNPMLLTAEIKTDLNKITTSGFYSLKNVANGPRGASWGTLMVTKADGATDKEFEDTIQTYIGRDHVIFTRDSIDRADWSEWRCVTPDISKTTVDNFKTLGWTE